MKFTLDREDNKGNDRVISKRFGVLEIKWGRMKEDKGKSYIIVKAIKLNYAKATTEKNKFRTVFVKNTTVKIQIKKKIMIMSKNSN